MPKNEFSSDVSIIELEGVPNYLDQLGRAAFLLHQIPGDQAEEAREVATELYDLSMLLREAQKTPLKAVENAQHLQCYLSIGE